MWDLLKKIAFTTIVTTAFATAAHAVSKLVIDDLADKRRAAREHRYFELRQKAAASQKKPGARRRSRAGGKSRSPRRGK